MLIIVNIKIRKAAASSNVIFLYILKSEFLFFLCKSISLYPSRNFQSNGVGLIMVYELRSDSTTLRFIFQSIPNINLAIVNIVRKYCKKIQSKLY